jgi:thymidine kinase
MEKEGRLELILGGMFTGKTTELMRRLLVEAIVEKGKVLYVNHTCDTRTDGDFSSHNVLFHDTLPESSGIKTLKTPNLSWLLTSDLIREVECIGIDEGQFFPEIAKVVEELVDVHHKHVIVASLSANYKRQQSYGTYNATILDLIPIADTVNLLKGKCHNCATEGRNRSSLFTYKSHDKVSDTLDIGASEKYMSLCRKCYVKHSTEN